MTKIKNIADKVKHHPVKSTLIGLGVLWFGSLLYQGASFINAAKAEREALRQRPALQELYHKKEELKRQFYEYQETYSGVSKLDSTSYFPKIEDCVLDLQLKSKKGMKQTASDLELVSKEILGEYLSDPDLMDKRKNSANASYRTYLHIPPAGTIVALFSRNDPLRDLKIEVDMWKQRK